MTKVRASTRLRRAALVAILAAITATATAALPGRAEAYGYCGKVGDAKVYARAVKCVNARYWVSRERCPWGWRRRLVFAEFEPAVIGWQCRKRRRYFIAIEA